MNSKILLVGVLLALLALSGCVQTEPEQIVSYKYICSNGITVDKAADCPIEEEPDLEALCTDYCNDEPALEENTPEYVKAELAKLNYCEVKDDCVETETKCPLGCYHMVNQAELEKANALVASFKQTCFQTCAILDDFECVEGKCEPILPGVG